MDALVDIVDVQLLGLEQHAREGVVLPGVGIIGVDNPVLAVQLVVELGSRQRRGPCNLDYVDPGLEDKIQGFLDGTTADIFSNENLVFFPFFIGCNILRTSDLDFSIIGDFNAINL